MTRAEAIEIARAAAKAQPPSYYSEPFEPHPWVVDAILVAASNNPINQLVTAIERAAEKVCEGLEGVQYELDWVQKRIVEHGR